MSEYSYEYVFSNNFDLDVFNNGPVSDTAFLDILKPQAELVCNVLLYNSGINSFSTFVEYNNNKYKITVNRV